jgi:hypothetical protein
LFFQPLPTVLQSCTIDCTDLPLHLWYCSLPLPIHTQISHTPSHLVKFKHLAHPPHPMINVLNFVNRSKANGFVNLSTTWSRVPMAQIDTFFNQTASLNGILHFGLLLLASSLRSWLFPMLHCCPQTHCNAPVNLPLECRN